ncbi:16S rRNA (cytosine(1402)-N(4))-methyltransferase RsmH, partial [bacterium]|nr:16S rRNA (cytosine(1402)-N(4))-methyltransferase RsmH [bacterium]
YKQEKLEQIFRDYGEERYTRSIVKAIIRARKIKPIERTNELVEIISKAVPARYRNSRRLHFATRVFQALRIATNNEFAALESALGQAVGIIKTGGKIVAVSYHSGEDRIVKHFFKKESRDCFCPPEAPVCVCGHKRILKIITKKPLRPKDEEVAVNPRARSAKLRVAEKI